MTRYCPTCGTEVDDAALFCPSCGRPIERVAQPAARPEPAEEAAAPEPVAASAPAPPPPPAPRPDGDDVARAEAAADEEAEARTEQHPRAAPPASDERAVTSPAAAPQRDRQLDIPVTWPTTLSGWLIGVGVVMAALGVLIGFVDRAFNPIDVLLLPALLVVAATVFFSATLPRFPHLALATLAVSLVAFGIGLDRIGFGGAGMAELLLFLGSATAAVGALVLALGHDQPLGGRGS